MSTVLMHSRSGSDSKLHLEIPVGRPDTEFDVEVVARPINATGEAWPPGYFDLFGSLDDESFVRPSQGELPPPVEL